MSASPFAQAAQDFVALGFQPVPILPPSASHHAGRGKAPGHITSGHWSGLSRWQTYRTTPPPDFLFKLWLKMPDAGVGLICGTPAGKDDQGEPLFVLGVDIDVDGDDLDTIVRALPHTPMAKAGRVGLTQWYRAPAEICSRSYDRPATVDAKAKRLVDLLAANRQSVVPPSIHAQTDAPYRWVGEAIAADQLPIFTPDDLVVLEEVLETLGWERGGRSAPSALRTARPRGDYQDEWAETNGEALARAEEWLPALDLPKTRQSRSGVWSAVPVWRDSCTGRPTDMRKPNLSVSTGQGGIPAGIRDFGASGAEASLTAIDVVQRARDCSAAEAKDWLRERLGLDDSGVVIDISGLWAHAEERDLPAPLRGLQPPRGPVAADVSEMSPTPPVELPPDLLDCPGLVGEISAWMSRTAQKPLPLLNLAAALCIVATAAGRKFAGPTEAGVALYFLALAGTGQGKAHPIRAGVHLMTKAGLGRMVAPSSWMSGSALIQHLERQPACVSFSDEVAEFLAKLNGAKASTHERAVSGYMRELWGINWGTFTPPGWASSRDRAAPSPIHAPAYSFMGLSVPDAVWAALQGSDVTNGFLNRFILFSTQADAEEQDPDESIFDVPEWLVARLQDLAGTGGPMALATIHHDGPTEPLIRIPWRGGVGGSAHQVFKALRDYCRTQTESETLMKRTAEIAIRLATVRAIGVDGSSAEVSVEDMIWGRDVALWSARRMIADAASYMSESDWQAKAKFVLRCISEAPGRRITRTALCRKVAHRFPARDLDAIIKGLQESAEIADNSSRSGRRGPEVLTYVAL